MEPVSPFKDLIPVKIFGGGSGDRGTSAVIDDLGRSLAGAFFQIIDADAVTASCDILRVHPKTAKGIDTGLSDLVSRQFCDKAGVHSIICKGNGYICLTAAVGGAIRLSLYETGIALRCKTQHDFSKGYNFFRHDLFLHI